MRVASSCSLFRERRSSLEGRRSRRFHPAFAASAATAPKNTVARRGPLSAGVSVHVLFDLDLRLLFFVFVV